MGLDVRLVNMPFARLGSPSLGLAQLKSVAESKLGAGNIVTIEYLNHYFGDAFGFEEYERISLEEAYLQSGFGDWIFREIAFPTSAGNAEGYIRRYGRIIGSDYIAGLGPGGKYSSPRLKSLLQDIIEDRQLHKADVVGFSSMFAQTIPSLAMARLLRERNRDQVILMGGANCEGVMGRTLADVVEDIDLIFSGPALISFPETLTCFLEGRVADIAKIDGVFVSGNSNLLQGISGEKSPAIYGQDLNIDNLVQVEYDDFFHSIGSFSGKIEISLPFETSRGCWWGQRSHCTFCGLNGASMAYRAMPAQMAREMIVSLVERYRDRASQYDCVDNIMAKEYVAEVFEGLRLGENVSIFYETKGDLDEEEIEILSLASVNRIQPGVESLLTSTLKLMKKGTTAFHNIRLLKGCITYNVFPSWNILFGFPGETEETFDEYQRLIPLLVHLPPPSGAFPVRFDRFSPYHSNPSSFGIDLSPADYYKYCYPYSEDVCANIAYYFQNTNIDSPYYVPMFDGLAPVVEAVRIWQEKWAAFRAPPRLELHQTQAGFHVFDSRHDRETTTPVSSATFELLNELRKAKDSSWAEAHFAEALEELRDLGWVFEERGRIMSLVTMARGQSIIAADKGEARNLEVAA